MGKRIINMIFNLVLVGVFFLGITPVLAESNPKLKINSITQGDNEVEYKDGKYIIKEYKYLNIDYELIDYDNDKSYAIVVEYPDGRKSGLGYNIKGKNNIFNVQVNKNNPNSKLKVCDNFECNNLYDELNVSFDFKLSEYINDSKLYVTKIEQDDKVLEGIPYNYTINNQMFNTTRYNINDLQQFYVTVKGQGFVDDAIYTLEDNISYNQNTYTGKELNDGVRIVLNPEYDIFYNGNIHIYRENMLITKVIDNNNDAIIIFKSSLDNIPNYDNIKLSYSNYKKVEINKKN